MVTYSVIIIVNEELAMKQKYREVKEPRELQILAALSDGSATEEQIQEVVDDINEHLSTATGTLMNYNGRFKKAGLKALQDNYKLFTNAEADAAIKTNKLMSNLMEMVMNAKKPNIPPKLIEILVEYLNGNTSNRNIEQKVKYIPLPFNLGTPVQNSFLKMEGAQKNI